MRSSRRRRYFQSKLVAEINVTPLVDVVLVLLIIFMVTAPMLSMGIDVDLPRVKSRTIDVNEEKLVLTIDKDQGIFINRVKIPKEDLKVKLENIFAARLDKELFLRADKTLAYGFVVEVMSEIRKAGVDKLGMVTETPEEKR
ncbi:MAG: biopolymer transporter ExbD [Pseudomonadota bacterium]|nr:biopolymer transporter ExbD [Pseudomonadota bacterium]